MRIAQSLVDPCYGPGVPGQKRWSEWFRLNFHDGQDIGIGRTGPRTDRGSPLDIVAPTQSPNPAAFGPLGAESLHPYEPAPATLDGNLHPRAYAWHRIPYEIRCSVRLARDQGCPTGF